LRVPELEFTPLGQEPVDPAYARFRDGWAAWIIEKRLSPGLRWSPSEGAGSWRTYALDKFDYIDFGVIGPKSPLAYRWQFGERPGYIWHWDGFFTPQWKLPDLWREVTDVYARIKGQRPAAVWNPYDGSWREVRTRTPAPPGHGTSPDDPVSPSELERRLDELIRLHREGKITDEILKQRTLELTREYG
jgi:hypothetical protein